MAVTPLASLQVDKGLSRCVDASSLLCFENLRADIDVVLHEPASKVSLSICLNAKRRARERPPRAPQVRIAFSPPDLRSRQRRPIVLIGSIGRDWRRACAVRTWAQQAKETHWSLRRGARHAGSAGADLDGLGPATPNVRIVWSPALLSPFWIDVSPGWRRS